MWLPERQDQQSEMSIYAFLRRNCVVVDAVRGIERCLKMKTLDWRLRRKSEGFIYNH